jgi:hypothetical protein
MDDAKFAFVGAITFVAVVLALFGAATSQRW